MPTEHERGTRRRVRDPYDPEGILSGSRENSPAARTNRTQAPAYDPYPYDPTHPGDAYPPSPSDAYSPQQQYGNLGGQYTAQARQEEQREISRRAKNVYGGSKLTSKQHHKYDEVGMLYESGYLKDQNNKNQQLPVPYFNDAQRREHEVLAYEGQLYKQGRDADRLVPLDTNDVPQQHYLYAMNKHGEIYAGREDDVHHHSAFTAGGPVAAAGKMRVDDGRLRKMTDESGHYMPPREYGEQVAHELTRRGVDISHVKFDYQGPSKRDLKKAVDQGSMDPRDRLYPDENHIRRKKY
ncbi:hypothetical protein F0U62_35195 [Cystobacter fuscus]|uniref:hypothetical protein n=1 Tax=Cystobacter fuscus TaxID=43 RepID=UPI002B285CB3|nr:hypothetical protein F0U62_35195 [Cystobacter fuscus]